MNTEAPKKTLIVYSSRQNTQNSKKLAEAIYEAIPGSKLASADNAPNPDNYDFIILGFGIYYGWPDGDMRAYMRKCINKDIGLFLTLGAYPDSDHAKNCMGKAEGLLSTCSVKARFLCHGHLEDAMIERMKARPAGSPHSWDEERAKRVIDAAKHPDTSDTKKASDIFYEAWKKLSASPIHKETSEKYAVLIAAFGSSFANAEKSYANIEALVKNSNLGIEVRRAYTSGTVRKKLEQNGNVIKSVPGVLKDLFIEGFTSVKVIALYMVPGEEYHKLCRDVNAFKCGRCGFNRIEITKPFLSSSASLDKICESVISEFPPERKTKDAVILMGHGNSHGTCDLNYIAAAAEFNRRDKNIFLASVEGKPEFGSVLQTLKDRKIRKAFLMPFMIVAGDHAINDMAGADANSWKSRLEKAGIISEPVLKGLGEYKLISSLFIKESDIQ